MPTDFMRVAGYPSLNFASGSTATWGGTRLRVALALDTTGSMDDNGKIAAMQSAAKQLIDTLAAQASTVDDVYVSVVPFAEMVNVGTVTRTPHGSIGPIGMPPTAAARNQLLRELQPLSEQSGSIGLPTATTPGTAASPTATSLMTPPVLRPRRRRRTIPTTRTVLQDLDCTGAPILAMTPINTAANVTTVKNKIDSLTAERRHQPGDRHGLGMDRRCCPVCPMAAPAKDPNYQYTDAIVLLSDGLNTIDRWYGDGSSPSSQVDARQKLLCDNIKTPVSGKSVVDLYDPGEHQRRPGVGGSAILRQPRKFLFDDDRLRHCRCLQRDRHLAV